MGLLSNFFSFDLLQSILIAAIPALICITVHELSHGYIAYKLGDNTAKDMGRLTLNPVKHIDILGLAMIVLVGFGWAKPVPVNMRRFKYPKWHMALTALAGPLSNLILAVITAIIFMLIPTPYGGAIVFSVIYDGIPVNLSLITLMFYRLIQLNIFLAVFNLLPIPPLDGSKVLFAFLPENAYYRLMRYERYGMILLLILVFSGWFLNFDIFDMLIRNPAESLLITIAKIAHNLVG